MTIFHVDNQRNGKAAEIPGIYVNLLADAGVPLRPAQEQVRVLHQKLIIEPGTEDQYHVHESTWEIFTVESGEVEALVNGEVSVLRKGDVFLARPGVIHRFANRTSQTVTITETRINVCPEDRHLRSAPVQTTPRKINEPASKSDDQLKYICARIRANILRMCHREGMSHVGSAFSMVEILVALYFKVMRIDPVDPKWPGRDIFILSKGHSCVGLYNVLAQAGFFSQDRLHEYCRFKSGMGGHPDLHVLPGIEVCSGSLGHGLPQGIGMALAAKRDKRDNKVFVLMGDGELDEGNIWEAAMAGAHYKLDNLIAIIDRNGLQADSRTEVAMALEPLDAKWRSFGWNVETVDGHDLGQLVEVLTRMREKPCPDKPGLVIAKTIKGKGVSFMEDQQAWHFNKPTAEDLKKGLKELGCQ